MLHYKLIQVYTSEEARWQGKPLSAAIIEHVRALKIAARCLVVRASGGCFESGDIATSRLEVLSLNMPLRIDIALPASELEKALDDIEPMVGDGLVAVQDLPVVSHKTRNRLLPSQIRVRDIMTVSPQTVQASAGADAIVRLLCSAVFTGVPVVDTDGRPLGVITQTDLIYRAGMPLRLGLLALAPVEGMAGVMQALSSIRAGEIMTRPPVTVTEDRLVTEAIDLMLKRGVKRLPVVNSGGILVGILSRVDIFRTIMRESPDWSAFTKKHIKVANLRSVATIMRRDTHAVLPETPIQEVARIIDTNDIQRVAVVNKEGRFLGLISDRELLAAFAEHEKSGLGDYLAGKIPGISRKGSKGLLGRLRGKSAAEVMLVDLITIREETSIEEAIRLMVEKKLKRLPVLDNKDLFKGLISRDALLRAGFATDD